MISQNLFMHCRHDHETRNNTALFPFTCGISIGRTKEPHGSMYPWFLLQIRTRSIGRIERFYQRISRSASSDVTKGDSISFLYKFGILNGISPGEINYRRCSESLRAHVSRDLSKWRICLEVLRVCPHTNRISSLTAITRSANDSIE